MVEALVEAAREDRGQDEVPRDDILEPRAGGGPGMLPDPAEGDDHGQSDGQGADGQRRPRPVAQDGGPGQALLEARHHDERGAGDPGQGRQGEWHGEGGDEQDPVDGERAQEGDLAGAAGPGQEADDRDEAEHGHEPAGAGASGGGQVQPGAQRLHGRDATGPPGGLGRRREGHDEPDREGGQRIRPGDQRTCQGDVADRAHPRRDRGRERRSERYTDHRPRQPDQRGLDDDVRRELSAPSARGAQEAELADALDDGHRQRVEDEERAREQGDRGDQRGRRRELAGRRAHRGRKVRWRRHDVGLAEEPLLEEVRDVRRGPARLQQDVDAGDPVDPEDRSGDVESRDDHPPVRSAPWPVAGEDPDDPQVDGRRHTLDADLAPHRQPVLAGQGRAHERGIGSVAIERGSRGEGQVMDPGLAVRIDAGDRDGGRQRARPERLGPQVGPSFERGSGDIDAIDRRDREDGRRGEADLAEGRHAQVRTAGQTGDGAIDRRLDPGIGGQAREQDGDAESHAEGREPRPQGPCPKAPPGEAVQTAAGHDQSPRAASRAMRTLASWFARRPSSMVSRTRPSPITTTRSA